MLRVQFNIDICCRSMLYDAITANRRCD